MDSSHLIWLLGLGGEINATPFPLNVVEAEVQGQKTADILTQTRDTDTVLVPAFCHISPCLKGTGTGNIIEQQQSSVSLLIFITQRLIYKLFIVDM